MGTTGDAPVDVARGFYDALARGDWDGLLAIVDDGVVGDLSRSGIPGFGSYEGRDAFVAGWTEWRSAWESYEVEVEELIPAGERVLSLTRVRGRSRDLGVDTELAGADVLTVRGGVIVRLEIFTDRDAARREAGL